jgi:predicted RNase H-like HicB family nuclease
MSEYIAVIHKDKNSDYGASFPDLPGVITVAEKLEDLRGMAEEALALHIEGMAEDGQALPSPSSLEAIAASSDYADAVALIVINAPDTDRPSVRVNITLPDTMLDRIDRRAAELGMTRSGFLLQAAKHEMERKAG